jgi:ComF family protein
MPSSLLSDFFSLFFPEGCHACQAPLHKQEIALCTSCSYFLPQTGYHLLPVNPVIQMFWGRVNVEAAAAYYHFHKGGKVQNMIHRLKYGGHQEIGLEIGKRYGANLKQSVLFKDCSLIVPVPLHVRKLKKRGFNQSELFGEGLSESMGLELRLNCLERESVSGTQTRQSRYSRWKNVETVFRLNNPALIEGQHVLLVDDVVTTGATLEACVRALLEARGVKVSIATMAAARA